MNFGFMVHLFALCGYIKAPSDDAILVNIYWEEFSKTMYPLWQIGYIISHSYKVWRFLNICQQFSLFIFGKTTNLQIIIKLTAPYHCVDCLWNVKHLISIDSQPLIQLWKLLECVLFALTGLSKNLFLTVQFFIFK